MNVPTLYIFSGLPAAGKTVLSQRLASRLAIPHLRIDTIEQALRELCGVAVEGEGYRLAYRIAADNLRLGLSVIADSCNPIELTRNEWEEVARQFHARYLNIEIICSDKNEHRIRVEARQRTSAGLPTWSDVTGRQYDAWTRERLMIDTAGKTEEESFNELLSELLARVIPSHPPASRSHRQSLL
jgi:predicted kinase